MNERTRERGQTILEIFAELSERYVDRQVFKMREGYVPIIKHDIAKRQWREKNKERQQLYASRHYIDKQQRRERNKDLQRLYASRHYYKKVGRLSEAPKSIADLKPSRKRVAA